MNTIDIILLIIVLLSAWRGWHKGFVVGVTDLALLIGSVLAAFYFYPYLASFLERYPSLGVWTIPLAFIAILILSRILLSLFVNVLLRNMPPAAHQHTVNRFFGIFPGLVNGLINAVIAAALLLALPFSASLSNKVKESRFADDLTRPAEWVEEKISPVFEEAVKKSMNKMTVEPSSDKTVTLPFKVMNPKVREDLEAKMLVLVNEERVKQGLKPVKADPEMAAVARKHSRDMFAKGYFSHVNLEGKDPFDRMRADKVRFLTAGENLALAQTLSIAHNGLMNSPGHRANILQPAFGRLGIGVLDGGIYGLMITQNFRN
jgi:uncharacterized protein YkwD